MPKDEEVRQAVFVNGKKLVEVGILKVKKSGLMVEFLYPEEFEKSLRPKSHHSVHIFDSTCFKYNLKQEITGQERDQIEDISSKAQEIVNKIETTVKDIYFISSIRGEIRHIVEIGVGEPRLGTHGEGLIEILSLVFRRPEYEKIAGKIINWASKFGMEEIKAGWWGGKYLSSDYIDPELRTRLNMALASQGSRQILTCITQLFWSRPGSVIMIEEPEISLGAVKK